MPEDTASVSWEAERSRPREPTPGLVLVFSGRAPQLAARTLGRDAIVLGRDDVLGLSLEDDRISRHHAAVTYESGRFRVRDQESRNGTFLDGERIRGEREIAEGVLRIGDTLILLRRDARPFLGAGVERVDGLVVGPTLRPVWRAIEGVAAGEECLHIRGETGTGKELAARHFHQSTERRKGPLSALNCATIPPALAERVLFGAKKGAYSGAEADSEGVIQAAHGGTLFLDEVAELDLAVQAKLLRVLEDGQVMPLGATKPVPVDVRLCSATHRDLSEEVARGRFRQDLYFRIGLPKVELPPLRARLEDLPLLLLGIAARAPGKPACHASLVEAALLRPWPGNVRELEKRVTDAARAAAAAGDKSIRASHLARATAPTTSRRPRLESITSTELPVDSSTREPLTRAAIERALRDTGGNVTAAAVALGLHRTQLRRLLLRLKIRRTQP